MKLTIDKLRQEANIFIKQEQDLPHKELVGITDGKAVGTYIEHKFKDYLKSKYDFTIGSTGKGIDLPDSMINTDIKVTSIRKPQSSTPFKNIEQKVYGLGHNLLIFVYEKNDINNTCYLDFKHCIFIESEKSGDYNLTKELRELIKNGGKKEEIIEILKDKNVPGADHDLEKLAQKILQNPPKQGYLTISNALQWRLKYNNIINLENEIEGIYDYDENYGNCIEDYQTPLYLTDSICEYLKNDLKISPDVIIEPTCGIGNFLKSISKHFPKKDMYGIEIDKNKLDKIDTTIPNLNLINEDIFTFKLDSFDKNNSFLIIGNPPWLSSNELLEKNSKNIHISPNFTQLKNFKFKISNENFDISEYIILKMIDEFKDTTSTIAFLCEKTVSRNIFIKLIKNKIPYSFIKQINFNHEKFKLTTDACLFIVQFSKTTLTNMACEVCDISNPQEVLYKFGFKSEKFYLDVDNTPPIDGKCQFDWKQGVKHDCAKIMEFRYENNQLINKNEDNIHIENSLIYPLLKCGDLKKPIVNKTSKYILITQQKIKQDTSYIKTKAPMTWKYLNKNKKYFDKRKSNTYNNAPDFSIFGIGEYSFKKYKVAISGFNKNPNFSLTFSEKTMMLDDSCYYLSFDKYDDAYITMLILNSHLVKKFLKNTAFLDSKRPYPKKLLKRIDIKKCLEIMTFNDLKETERKLELKDQITKKKFLEYKNNVIM